MSTDSTTERRSRTVRDPRRFALERAFSTPLERPAWKQNDPDDSAGHREVHTAQCDTDVPIGHEEVTSS